MYALLSIALLAAVCAGVAANNPPRIAATERMVRAEEGSYATLSCVVQGNPTPTISWRKDSVQIDGTEARHKLLPDGSLQIIGLSYSDGGRYVCIADNGVAPPAQRQLHLDITDPVDKPAEIIGEPNAQVTLTLGAPGKLHCYAYGSPRPSVTWWQGDRMLPLVSEQFTQTHNFSLIFHSVAQRNLGPYTCQAYNGLGKATTWTVTVQAHGSAYSTDPEDFPFAKYLVYAPRRQEAVTPSWTAERQHHYRVVRPRPELSATERSVDASINQHPTQGVSPTPRSNRGVHPTCTDDPEFANCQLIVRAQYCTHTYYRRFCCKSCTLAGQLPSHDPSGSSARNK